MLSMVKPFKVASVVAVFLLWSGCAVKPGPRLVSAEQKSAAAGAGQPEQNHGSLNLPISSPSILVKKSQRQMLLLSAGKVVRRYRIGLGLSPVGDKVRAGDRRTPEGDFYVFTKNSNSAFYLSLGLSYPNAAHAQRGLRDGLITRSQYEAIVRALKMRKAPPQNTRLGGDIYIHGNGSQSDWTWGCIALEDRDMRELFDVVPVGTHGTSAP